MGEIVVVTLPIVMALMASIFLMGGAVIGLTRAFVELIKHKKDPTEVQ